MTIDIVRLQKAIGYQAEDVQLLETALCHKSYAKEQDLSSHNEKLEFLGDAVLDLVIADLLMSKYDQDQEGNLSRKRASIVNEDHLADLARERQMQEFILLGKSELKNQLNENPRILASAFEAVVGAIYLDKGYDEAHQWLADAFHETLEKSFDEHDFEKDYKTRLQEAVQEIYKTTPKYNLIEQSGPDHDKTFVIEVKIDGEVWAEGRGSSKKAAAQDAAQKAMERLPS